MQTEILSDLREAKRAMADAKEKLDVMNVSLMGYIIDSIREYNEAYEKKYILSTEDVVKQPKKRKPGRPKGSVSNKTPKKSTEMLDRDLAYGVESLAS